MCWLATRELPGGGQHGVLLPLELERLLLEARVSRAELTGFVVGLGPGSFTGLRIGVATLKGLAYGLRLPLAGASSLRAIASEAQRVDPVDALVVLLDARQGEVYAACFTGGRAEPTGVELSLPPAKLAEHLAGELGESRARVRLVGEGAAVYREVLLRDFSASQLDLRWLAPKARFLGDLCWPLPAFSLPALCALEPHYVRPSEAELKFPEGNFRARPQETETKRD